MIRELWSQLRFFLHRKPAQELDDELRAHMEQSVEIYVAQGLSEDAARRRACIDFGSMEAARERCNEERPGMMFDVLRQDARYALRTLRRDRGFAIVTILILALGIGANIVVFSLVNTILLRPLPFSQPDRLAWIAPAHSVGLSEITYSADAYDDFRAMNRSYTDITAYYAFSSPDNLKLMGRTFPKPVTAISVAPNFFRVLGLPMALGRDFSKEESQPNGPNVAILSYAFWMSEFRGDKNIAGKAVSTDNGPMTIVGVLPKSFDYGAIFAPGSKVDVLAPLHMDDIRNEGNTVTLIGRLRSGVTLQQANAEAQTLFPQFYWSKKEPASKGSYPPPTAITLRNHVSGELRRSLYVLWAAVGMILLIVCVNLSNLLLARATARSKEFALRIALGAGRSRLVTQLLTESAVLTVAGTLVGLSVAFVITAWLAHQGSLALPLLNTLHVDLRVLLWTILLAVVATLLFGLAPGLQLATGNIHESLKDTGAGASDGRQHQRLRTSLVVSQIALACVLLVGAGLLLRSFLHVLDIDLGFRPGQSASLRLDMAATLDTKGNMTADALSVFYQKVLHGVAELPGIESAGITDSLPLATNRSWSAPRIKGVSYRPNELPSAFVYVITPGYLPTLGAHLHGRDFAWTDSTKSESVVILNKTAADYLFHGKDAVGHMVTIQDRDVRVIGVVPEVRQTGVEEGSGWQMYLPVMQDGWGPSGAQLVVRSPLPPNALQATLLAKLHQINPDQPAVTLHAMQDLVDRSTSPRRFFAMLVALFAGLGLFLASIGIYGVISYSITRQTQEIGIRMALGASREHVRRGVIARTLRLALIGVAIGTVTSFAVAKAISSLLFAMEPYDPMTFIGMVLVLLAVAFVAGYLPARRASRIDPLIALRSQ